MKKIFVSLAVVAIAIGASAFTNNHSRLLYKYGHQGNDVYIFLGSSVSEESSCDIGGTNPCIMESNTLDSDGFVLNTSGTTAPPSDVRRDQTHTADGLYEAP